MDIHCNAGFGGCVSRVVAGGGVYPLVGGRGGRVVAGGRVYPLVGGRGGRVDAAKSPQGVEIGDGLAGGIIKIYENLFSFFVPSADPVCVWLQGFFAVAAFVVAGGAVEAEVGEGTV